ncbi:restriction endonuclease subunit S domain-containing protein [Muricoccus pecuniae]|uniref:Type I restriction enzyme S subunit n=1 Tax=Muricoccus pecuniae TaxID=693023 RepID=A0A840YHX2_9PROT|nr:restriction endonuclease subunit S [Roseomonas pecuniae]MBB5693593.1 type I restriction enzyme S subunit [Roseomonas pecuniae]
MSLPVYSAYKDSGSTLLGAVPAHWPVVQFKRVARLAYGAALPTESRNDAGSLLAYGSNGPVGCHDVANTKAPVIIVGRKGSYGALNWSDAPVFAIDTAYFVDQSMADCDLRWLYWAYYVANFAAFSQDTGVPGLARELVHDMHFVRPPSAEQLAIAAFLDRETAKIDDLITQQERLIALLEEKKQATISHAVTKGLDPSVPMKDSGIEWLGEIPAHWHITRIKYVTRTLEQGWSPQCDGYPVDSSEAWGVLKVGCVNGGRFNPNENKTLPLDLEPIPNLGLRAGDVLVSRANTRELVGSAAVVLVDHPRLMLCDKLYRLRMNQVRCLPEFLARFLGSNAAREQIGLAAGGASSSMLNISQDAIMDLPLPLPSLREQKDILGSLDRHCRDNELLTAEVEHGMALLKERRAALISAAVTGKIDVRGFVNADLAMQEAAE